MTSTNVHPRTAARGPRRAFLLHGLGGLLTAILAASTPARAQGVIDFSVGMQSFTEYRVGGDGTGLGPLEGFPQISFPYVVATTPGSRAAWARPRRISAA